MSAFTILEARIKDAVGDLRTDEKADLRQALADVKAELEQAKQDAGQIKAEVLGQVQPILAQFEGAVKVAVETAEPGVQSNVTGLVAKVLADVAKVAGL